MAEKMGRGSTIRVRAKGRPRQVFREFPLSLHERISASGTCIHLSQSRHGFSLSKNEE